MPSFPIQLKRNGTAAATPSSLLHGEVALNYADGKLFWKDASNVIRSFTFQAYALSSHTHAASDITSGTLDAARLPLATTIAAGAVIVGTGLGVSSGTVSVTYGTNSTSACRGDDSRLSDTRTPTDGSVTTAKIANDAVTYAKIQNVSATDRLLGRSSAGSGDVEEITCTAFGRSLIDDADAAAARSTLSVQPTASPAFTGAATVTNDGNVVPLTVTNTGTANSFVVNDASGDTSPFVIDASGNVGIGITPTSLPLTVFSFATSDADKATLLLNGTVASGQSFAGIRFTHNVFSTGWAADIRCVDTGNFGGILSFRTSATGSATATPTERLKIDAAGVSTFSGQLLVTAGSGSSGSYKPGIAVSGDDDTGLQQVGGANTISLVTAGSERVRVDASGNVGIGATPSFRLDVLGSANCVAKIKTSAAGSFGCLQIHNANTNGETSIGFRDDSDSDASSWVIGKSVGGVADAFAFYYNGNRAIIESDGVVKLPDVYEDTVGATNRDLFIDNAGKLGYVSSIRASKTNITAIDDVSWLRDLTPVSFHYRKRNEDGTYSDEADGTLDYGLIAEDVEPVAPEMCFYDFVDGEPQLRGVHYSKLITPMLRYIQQLEQRIAALEERLNHA